MLQVLCPLRARCPYYGETRKGKNKKRCYGRICDLAVTNGDVWLRFRCPQTKQVMVIRQRGSQIVYGDEGEQPTNLVISLPKDFSPIRCPVCGQWIMDIYLEAGGFLMEFKCPTHRKVVSWGTATLSHRSDHDDNVDCA